MARPAALKLLSILPQAPVAVLVLLLGFLASAASRAEPTEVSLEHRFTQVVHPFVRNYCLPCHGLEKTKAKLDLSAFTSPAAIAKSERTWDHVIERLEAQEMPPQKAPRQPTPHERRAVLDWLRDFRDEVARRHA